MLQTPFSYDPANGNLLLEFIIPTAASIVFGPGFGALESFDASVASNDGVASVSGFGNSMVGAAVQSGLITRFTFEPVSINAVPEPGTVTLLAIGGIVGCVGVVRRRRSVSTNA